MCCPTSRIQFQDASPKLKALIILQLQDFLEGEFLTEQVESIKQLSDFIAILRRTESNPVGWHIFDEELYNGKR